MNMPRSFRLALATGLVLNLLAGCNTVQGAGRDIESVGKAAERAIN